MTKKGHQIFCQEESVPPPLPSPRENPGNAYGVVGVGNVNYTLVVVVVVTCER